MIFILVFKNVSKYYKKTPGIINLSFSIKEGELLGVLGTNGSGKTTTFRLLMNLLDRNEGTITFKGTAIKELPFSQLGYLPEERSIYKDLSVYEQVHFFGKLKQRTNSQIDEHLNYWLDFLKIKQYKYHKIRTLSKGNQQKIQLICSIVHDPLIIVLDEPFSGLDVLNVQLFIRVLEQLKKSGKYLLISSHNYDYLDDLCESIILLDKGNVLLNDNLNKLKNNYQEYYLTIPNNNYDYSSIKGVKDVYYLGKKVRLIFKNKELALIYLKNIEQTTSSFNLEQATINDLVRNNL